MRNDYMFQACKLFFAVALALLLIHFLIPEDQTFRTVDILSDIRSDKPIEDSEVQEEVEPEVSVVKPEVKPEVLSKQQKRLKFLSEQAKVKGLKAEDFVLLEDWTEESKPLAPFFEALSKRSSLNRPLRIAVLGDSFIEGDIFTSPLRKSLQAQFGGLGVGFMGLSSEIASFRKTIKHYFKAWHDQSVLTNAQIPHIISGHVYLAEDGARVTYRMPKGEVCYTLATLYYSATETVPISIEVDDELKEITLPDTGGELMAFELYSGVERAKLSMTILSNARALTTYGLALEGKGGISLDNLSLRGASGLQLSAVNTPLSTSFAQERPYDLIVWEYGLNVVSAKRKSYTGYRKSMKIVLKHIRKFYPTTPILVLGVSDRDEKNSDNLHQNTLALLREQRRFAREEGLVFWSILDGVQALGGIKKMTKKGLAAKDFTHVSAKGGELVAKQLFNALLLEYDYYEANK